MASRVKPGLDVLLKRETLLERLSGLSIGLVVNHTSVTRSLEPSYLRFLEKGIRVKTIFTPEHGLWGAYAAGEPVESESLSLNRVRVQSLYGPQRKPSVEALENLDLLVYDIQDVGCRTYTYISTMLNCFEEACRNSVGFMVLDRPNPLGGLTVEGPVLKKGLESFVGPYYLPLRYGMTPGELCLLYAYDKGLKPPHVVRMSGWSRMMHYRETGLPWVYPSPAIPTPVTALLYSGMVLLEATNLSEGRGTYKPFEVFGAPWLKSAELVSTLKRRLGKDCLVMETRFIPFSSKHKGQVCRGVHLLVQDPEEVRPFKVAVHIIQSVLETNPVEFEVDHGKMDRLLGDSETRRNILSGMSVEEIVSKLREEQKKFKARIRRILLYD
ncbi:MAG: exo-beta-N-acetylmuramidase NamZ family protein [Thermoproteota archaeon]